MLPASAVFDTMTVACFTANFLLSTAVARPMPPWEASLKLIPALNNQANKQTNPECQSRRFTRAAKQVLLPRIPDLTRLIPIFPCKIAPS